MLPASRLSEGIELLAQGGTATATVLDRTGTKVTLTSLTVGDPNASYDTLVELLAFVGQVHKSSAWWVGDAINQIERRHGDKVYQAAADVLRLAPQTCANYASICTHVPRVRRREELEFSHHAEVAYKDPDEQEYWLNKAIENNWKRAELRAAIRGVTTATPAVVALPPAGEMQYCPHCGGPLNNYVPQAID